MHQYFILVLVSIVTVLNFIIKMVILCIALFLLVTRPVGHKMLKYFMSDHECQVAKGMRWGILIVSSPARSAQSYCCHLGRPRLRLRLRPRHTFG